MDTDLLISEQLMSTRENIAYAVSAMMMLYENEEHTVFTKGDYNLNIYGIRNPSKVSDSFDDLLGCFYKVGGIWRHHAWEVTTDPGKKYLEKFYDGAKGTAILCGGQYRGVYQIGKHRNQYEALCQPGGKGRVYRDGNKDDILDMNTEDITEGWYGINIHRASDDRVVDAVGGYSAGCQVFRDSTDFGCFMLICSKAAEIWGNSFTYTLFEE